MLDFFLVTYLVLSILSSIILLIRVSVNRDWNNNILKDIVQFIMILSIPFIVFLVYEDPIEITKKHIENKKRRKKELELRKEKIKLGIIRISSLDPYGEENWNE